MGPDHDDDANGDAAPGATDPGAEARHLPPLDRRHILLLCTPIAVLLVMAQIGSALFPQLSTQGPYELLLILSAPNRNLAIAATRLPFVVYAGIAFVRLLAADPFFYELGWHYGDRAVSWMERRTPMWGMLLRQLEGWFAKAGWLFVLIMPNNYVCLLAGSARMRRSWFWALNVVGTIGRIIVMYYVGVALADLIDSILGWVARYRFPLLAVSIAFVVLTTAREWRSGTTGVQQIIKLEHELEDELENDGKTGGKFGGKADEVEEDQAR